MSVRDLSVGFLETLAMVFANCHVGICLTPLAKILSAGEEKKRSFEYGKT